MVGTKNRLSIDVKLALIRIIESEMRPPPPQTRDGTSVLPLLIMLLKDPPKLPTQLADKCSHN